jgi:REP element-mobilizing transposase RayT
MDAMTGHPDPNHVPWSPSPRRKPMRLRGFDYHDRRMYFVTPVTHHRIAHFGTVHHGAMVPSPVGVMVAQVWQEIPRSYPEVTLDAWVVMPNHLHGLLLLEDSDDGEPHALGDIVRWFKTITTNRYIHGVRDQGWPRFPGHLWQRNYYDHLVRTDPDLDRIRTYIATNPATWGRDALYDAPEDGRSA